MKYEDGLRSLVMVKQLALRLHHTSNFLWIHVLKSFLFILDAHWYFDCSSFAFLRRMNHYLSGSSSMAATTRHGNIRSKPLPNNKIKEKRSKERQRIYSKFVSERHRIFGSLKWPRMALSVRYSHPHTPLKKLANFFKNFGMLSRTRHRWHCSFSGWWSCEWSRSLGPRSTRYFR